jgi:VCBS repeat-containing protein
MAKKKSASFGPQAKNDRGAADKGGILSIDVLANDSGGAAKKIWSFDQADPSKQSTFTYLPGGATVGIGGDGLVLYKANDKFAYLQEGEIAFDSFTYAIRLGNGTLSLASVTVRITGVNDPALLSKARVDLVEGDDAAAISTSGKLTIYDVDSPDLFVAGSQKGLYGTLTLEEDGDWTYLADGAHDEFKDGKTYSDLFTVASVDGTTTKVQLIILGTADPAPTNEFAFL